MLVRPHSDDDGFMLFWDTSQQNLLTGAACTKKMKSNHPLNGLEITILIQMDENNMQGQINNQLKMDHNRRYGRSFHCQTHTNINGKIHYACNAGVKLRNIVRQYGYLCTTAFLTKF